MGQCRKLLSLLEECSTSVDEKKDVKDLFEKLDKVRETESKKRREAITE